MRAFMATLCELADRNRDALSRRFEEIPQGPRRVRRDEVRAVVERDGRLSVNLSPAGLQGFLDSGRLKNRFDLAREQASVDGVDALEIVRASLKVWAPRRVAFETAFDGSPGRLYYGALNVEGLGAPRYGDFCVVAKAESPHRAQTCWIAWDSLKGPWFVENRDQPDPQTLETHLAAHEDVGKLAALKLDDRSPIPESHATWKSTLCSDSDYVEAAFRHPIRIADVEAVRVDAQAVRAIRAQLLARPPQGADRDAIRDAVAAADVFRLLRERSVPVVEVERRA